MKKFKKIISIIMIAALIASVAVVSTLNAGAAATGAGLAEWALNAYYSGWTYVWGGASPGAVDCSGLIYSYCGGNRTSMLSDAQANGRDWGYVSSGIPRVHGLGLSRPGHVGVYIGDGMEVDARGTGYNMCYEAVGSSWSCWFKLTAVSYPTSGWEQFNGNSYYYENGEYIVNTSRTIDGVTYYFDSTGKSSSQGGAVSASDSSSSDSSTAASVKADDNGPLKNGSQGERVEKLQSRLQELGYYSGVVDGDFGDMTEKAFKLFQKQAGLYVDGIAGSDTDYLYADNAPVYTAEKNSETAEDKSDDLAETGVADDSSEDTADESGEDNVQNDEMCYQSGDYGDEIVPIQLRLIDLGYLDDEADGGYGSNTETAVKDFQNNNGLIATGIVDQTTYDALFSDSAIKNPHAKAEKADEEDEDKEAEDDKTEETAAAKRVAAVASTTSGTEVEMNNSALSAKAVAGVTNSISVRKTAASTNLEFILWLAIMIVVMLIAFTIVYAVEKRKARVAAARARRRFQ